MPVIGLSQEYRKWKSTVSRRLKALGAEIIDAVQVARDVVHSQGARLWRSSLPASARASSRKTENWTARPQANWFLLTPGKGTPEQIPMPGLRRPSRTRSKNFWPGLPLHPIRKYLLLMRLLLIEVGLHTDVDELWVVKIDEDKQIERLSRRTASPEEIRSHIAAQLPQEEKLKYAEPDHRQQR